MNLKIIAMIVFSLFLIGDAALFAQTAGLRLSDQELAVLNAKKANLEKELNKRIEEINTGKAQKLTPEEAVALANKQMELTKVHAQIKKQSASK